MDRGAWWATVHEVAKGQRKVLMELLVSQGDLGVLGELQPLQPPPRDLGHAAKRPALAGGLFTAESLLLLLLSRFSRVQLCATP